MSQRSLHHSTLGGVTDWHGRYFAFHISTQPFFRSDVYVGPSSVFDSLVDPTVSGLLCSSPSASDFDASQHPLPLTVVQGVNRRHFQLRLVFTKFCRRRPTVQERALAFDFPGDLLSQLSDSVVDFLLGQFSSPVKAIVAVGREIDSYMQHDWGQSRPKHACTDDDSPVPVAKYLKVSGIESARPPLSVYATARDTWTRFAHYKSTRLAAGPDALAAKADSAEVPTYLWDDRITFLLGKTHLTARESGILERFCSRLHRVWVRRVSRLWWRWWDHHSAAICQRVPVFWDHIFQAGVTAVVHAARSTFWDWPFGSAPFFWRWAEEGVVSFTAWLREESVTSSGPCVGTISSANEMVPRYLGYGASPLV